MNRSYRPAQGTGTTDRNKERTVHEELGMPSSVLQLFLTHLAPSQPPCWPGARVVQERDCSWDALKGSGVAWQGKDCGAEILPPPPPQVLPSLLSAPCWAQALTGASGCHPAHISWDSAPLNTRALNTCPWAAMPGPALPVCLLSRERRVCSEAVGEPGCPCHSPVSVSLRTAPSCARRPGGPACTDREGSVPFTAELRASLGWLQQGSAGGGWSRAGGAEKQSRQTLRWSKCG